MVKRLVIHIGYPKTGTTTIQKNILEEQKNIRNLSEYIKGKIEIGKVVEEAKDLSPEVSVVASNEGILDFRSKYCEKIDTISRQIRKENFPSDRVTVLVTIRNQLSLIKSSFSFWSNYFEQKGYKNINNLIKKEIYTSGNIKLKSWLNFNNTVSKLEKELPNKSKIRVIKYEDMYNNRERFSRHLSDILGVEKSNIMEGVEIKKGRNVNKIRKKYTKPNWLYRKLSVLKSRWMPDSRPLSEFPMGRKVKYLLSTLDRKIEVREKSLKIISSEFRKKNKRLFSRRNMKMDEKYSLIVERK